MAELSTEYLLLPMQTSLLTYSDRIKTAGR